ncbi:hypothetical protein GCM10014715_78030 [Streptomyces spiralis]|uniref:Uncharacterized protein n=1 Tax=Streptomyces spiralis TaxID=66376 RepID=A0A919E480_9ACTN|nr:hypothetical protein GCM10014715_78030 [Streptomyces spiralis]
MPAAHPDGVGELTHRRSLTCVFDPPPDTAQDLFLPVGEVVRAPVHRCPCKTRAWRHGSVRAAGTRPGPVQ